MKHLFSQLSLDMYKISSTPLSIPIPTNKRAQFCRQDNVLISGHVYVFVCSNVCEGDRLPDRTTFFWAVKLRRVNNQFVSLKNYIFASACGSRQILLGPTPSTTKTAAAAAGAATTTTTTTTNNKQQQQQR